MAFFLFSTLKSAVRTRIRWIAWFDFYVKAFINTNIQAKVILIIKYFHFFTVIANAIHIQKIILKTYFVLLIAC